MFSGDRRQAGRAVVDRVRAGAADPGFEVCYGLGEPLDEPPWAAERSNTMATKEQVYEALHECYDPEIPVNIVELGLVYDVEVKDEQVAVKMTLTAPGCGMGAMIANDARQRILALDGVVEATVDLVWDPPWNPKMISEA